MTLSILQRTTAWLCIAVALLTGTAPAQGFVLCIEADGCVRVEGQARDADCAGCEGHELEALPNQAAASSTGVPDCPCVDLALPGCRQEQRFLPKPIDFSIGSWIERPPEFLSQHRTLAGLPVRAPPTLVPRPPDSLALIRTVVLLT